MVPDMEEVLSDLLLLSFHPGRSSLWGWGPGDPRGNGSRERHVFKACRMSSQP